MTVLAIQHAFQGLSGLPRDRFVNTWHVIVPTGTPSGSDLLEMADAVKGFYVGGGATSVQAYISPWAGGSGRTVKIYNLDDTLPRAPIYEFSDPDPISGLSGTGFPNEVAICLSFHAAAVSGAVQARRRGRIYVGPLNTASGSITPVGDSRPNPTLRTAFLSAAGYADLQLAAAGASWCVYSPTSSTAVKNEFYSVDDAFDTQRRRGLSATLVQSIASPT